MSEVMKDAVALGALMTSIGILAVGFAADSPALAVFAVAVASVAAIARVKALHAAQQEQQEDHSDQQDHLAAGS